MTPTKLDNLIEEVNSLLIINRDKNLLNNTLLKLHKARNEFIDQIQESYMCQKLNVYDNKFVVKLNEAIGKVIALKEEKQDLINFPFFSYN